MTNEQRDLQQLIDDGIYVVDAQSVARAIVARACVLATVAHAGFANQFAPPIGLHPRH